MRRSQKWLMALGLMVATACASSAAHAQVVIEYGGTPARMSGIKTVALEREEVGLRVGNGLVHVVGRYRLKNRGKAGALTVGFPAFSYGGDSTLSQMRVASQGRPLKTRVVGAGKLSKIGNNFYAVSVALKASETREISCDYRVSTGGFLDGEQGKTYSVDEADYSNGGGSTWNGPVGSSRLTFRFERPAPTAPLRPFDMRANELKISDSSKAPWSKLGRNAVPYVARGTVRAQGTALHISRANFRPKADEVTTFFFGFRYL